MNIVEMLVPDRFVFPGSWGYVRKWLILHKTAGFHTAQEVAAYFQAGAPQPDGSLAETSVHYVIGQDGLIVRCVREADGAGGNGVLEAGHDPWWTMDNPNLVTFSIEHVDPSLDNSTPLTAAQKTSSFWLIRDLCTRQHIPMRTADASGGITGHFSIDPQSRAHCPGNYPWQELWNYLKGATSMSGVPEGWSDNGTKLVAQNGHFFVKGFRDHILNAPNWDPGDVPLEEEQQVNQVEVHTSRGAGTRQLTRLNLLVYTDQMGVKESAAGQEIAACYNLIASLRKQISDLQTQIKNQPPASDQLKQAQSQIIDLQHKIVTAQEALK